MRIAVITPFLNEQAYLGRYLAGMERQERPPDLLLLVDDGSDDGSPEIAADFAGRHPYARLLRRPSRPPERDRLATASELRSFQWGLEHLDEDIEVVAKLDADIELTPATLRTLEEAFTRDPLLGVAGPYLSAPGADGVLVRQRGRPEHVAGPVKFYRRRCHQEMGPITPILGWDTVDDFAARRAGWRTASLAMPDGDPVHLRPMGSHDGRLRAWRRWGLCAWGSGQHPLHVLLVAAQRLSDRPPVAGSLNYVFGYVRAAARRSPRVDPELRAFVRREQMARVGTRLRRGARGATPTTGGANTTRRRICMVVHSRFPNDPRVHRATRMARGAGFEVDLVCLSEPGLPRREVLDEVRVWRLPVTHRRGVGAVRMVWEYAAFALLATFAVALRAGRRGYDVVHVHNPPDFLPIAALVPRLRGAKVIFDVHDLSPLMFQERFEGRRLLLSLIHRLERLACRFADGVVTVHEPYREELAAHGVDPGKVTVVMNTPDEELIEAARHRAAVRPREGQGWRAIYHGTITEWYGLPTLIRGAALARERIPDLRLAIIGEGDDLDRAHAAADELGLRDRVSFSDRYLPIREVLDLAAASDCGVIPNLPSALNDLTLSSKLLEYVALGIPVVAARLRTLAHHFADGEVTFYDPADPQALAEAMVWVHDHPEEARAKAQRAERRARAYRWSENRDRYVELLDALAA